MPLKFAPRVGGPKSWERAAIITNDDATLRVTVHMSMKQTGSERIVTDESGKRVVVDDRKRTGTVRRAFLDDDGKPQLGEVLWTGDVPLGPTPLRATCVAAGLVDDNGKELPLPDWVK